MTAVEWLLENIGLKDNVLWQEVIEQAKEMEKEQIIKAYNISWKLRDKPYATAEKYYKQTFKSE